MRLFRFHLRTRIFLGYGFLIALLLGWLARRFRWAYLPTVSAGGLLYTIPSLVLLLVLPGLLGSALSIWGPLPESTEQTASGVEPHLAVLAQKTWDSPPPAATFRGFSRDAHRVGLPS